MPNRDNQVIAYLSDSEYKQLKEWSDETGKSMSHLLREAVLEYTDNDRTRRIEEKVDELLDTVGTSESDLHTHTNSSRKSVPEKTRAIAEHLYQHHDAPVKETDIELAIENIADVGDDRSVKKYKRQLKKRDLLFEHPLQPVWTDDKEEWVRWVEGAMIEPDISDVTDDYRMDTDEYIEISEEVTQ